MQQELRDKIIYCVGDEQVLEKIEKENAYAPFSEETICFLNDFSKRLNTDSEAKNYADVQTFAFWCRKASVYEMRKHYTDLSNRLGRGLSFHIAPSNIPTMFAFSLVASMLAGNSNLIRIASKDFAQTRIICRIMSELLETEQLFKNRILVIKYSKNDDITRFFSERCRSRIIWGGDFSINNIRAIPVSPAAIELPFYDRFSFAVIKAERFLDEDKKEILASKFYNDTYLSDQNACTSPQLVVWIGNDPTRIEEARKLFWSHVEKVVEKQYNLQSIQAVDKFYTASRYAIEHKDGVFIKENMTLCRMEIKELYCNLKDYRCPGGYFYEYVTDQIEDIVALCKKECQTLSYYGFEGQEILDIILKNSCDGVDRIVPIGETMNFRLCWDGFDLIESLTRRIG